MSLVTTLRSPGPNSIGVAVDAPITITVSASGENIGKVEVYVDDVLGFEYDSGFYIFHPPAMRGAATTSSTLVVVTLRCRRRFAPNTAVNVRVVASGTVTAAATYEARFFAALPSSSLRDQSLRTTRTDSAFPASCRSLDVYRRSLLGAFGAGNGSFLVALVHRVKRCQLMSLLPASVNTDTVREAIEALLPHEVTSVDELDEVVTGFAFLWPGTQDELAALGVAPETIEVITRSHEAPYPQERVGAACLAVLLAAEALSA